VTRVRDRLAIGIHPTDIKGRAGGERSRGGGGSWDSHRKTGVGIVHNLASSSRRRVACAELREDSPLPGCVELSHGHVQSGLYKDAGAGSHPSPLHLWEKSAAVSSTVPGQSEIEKIGEAEGRTGSPACLPRWSPGR
jgi:hypothetical protein